MTVYLEVETLTDKGKRAAREVLQESEDWKSSELIDELGFVKKKLVEKFIQNMRFESSDKGFNIHFSKVSGAVINKSKGVVEYMMTLREAMLGADYTIEVKQG